MYQTQQKTRFPGIFFFCLQIPPMYVKKKLVFFNIFQNPPSGPFFVCQILHSGTDFEWCNLKCKNEIEKGGFWKRPVTKKIKNTLWGSVPRFWKKPLRMQIPYRGVCENHEYPLTMIFSYVFCEEHLSTSNTCSILLYFLVEILDS